MEPTYRDNDRVRVIDPADRRKRVNGTVLSVDYGRGPTEYRIRLDDDPTPMAFSPDEITGRVERFDLFGNVR